MLRPSLRAMLSQSLSGGQACRRHPTRSASALAERAEGRAGSAPTHEEGFFFPSPTTGRGADGGGLHDRAWLQ